jgi:hypothetical protein
MLAKIDRWLLGRMAPLVRYVDRYFAKAARHRRPA